MTTQLKTIAILFLIFSLFSACGDDMKIEEEEMEMEMEDLCEDVDASYKDDISGIIAASCAISGCHVAGFSSGDWSEYQEVSDNAGSIKNRAIDQKNMPPANSSAPKLTASQLELLSCWIAGGAENN